MTAVAGPGDQPDLSQPEQHGDRAAGRRSRRRSRRVRLADRAERLRQEHPAATDRRPRRAHLRHPRGVRQDRRARRASTRTTASPFSRPACCPGARSRPTSSCRCELHGVERGARRARVERAARAGRPGRLRRVLPRSAVRRHAAAGRHRPRAGRAAPAAADGRAVRRPGRDDPGADAERTGPDLRRDRGGRGVRDALDPGGGVPLRPGRGDVAPARADRRRRDAVARRSGVRDDALREDDAFFHAVAPVREALHGVPTSGTRGVETR